LVECASAESAALDGEMASLRIGEAESSLTELLA
jgi:hypothetical protein